MSSYLYSPLKTELKFTLKMCKQRKPLKRPFLPFRNTPPYINTLDIDNFEFSHQNGSNFLFCLSLFYLISSRTWENNGGFSPICHVAIYQLWMLLNGNLPTRIHQVVAFWFDSVKIRTKQTFTQLKLLMQSIAEMQLPSSLCQELFLA